MNAIINLCTRLGVSSDWLLGLDKNPPPKSENRAAALKKAILAILEEY